MTVKTEAYTRKPFPVDAVQVSDSNLRQVARWCKGVVQTTAKTVSEGEERTKEKVRFIKVEVHNPSNERHTKAFVGDWVLKSDTGFKVYTKSAFEKAFELADGRERFPEPTVVYTEAEAEEQATA